VGNERSGVLVRVEALSEDAELRAKDLALHLGLPLGGEADFSLQCDGHGVQLADLGAGAPGPIRVDFVGGAVGHRRQFGGGSGQMIAKAVGIQTGVRPTVVDATAGLGRDAFVLATLGCEVTLIERQPLIAVLLDDGLARARSDPEVAPIVARMRLRVGDAIQMLRDWDENVPQVVYLDPMFPHRDKSALVKKEMRLFRPLVGDDVDAERLLEAALALASHRVVVKRPRKAPAVAGGTVSFSLEGNAGRFDVYAKRSLKEKRADRS
jgi:16S rRNA (guanine1516-N2)-methyltransferase